ncbi:MAG: hypothetical protein WC977_10740 [Anaerovoracaceae bacterium]
MADRPDRYEHVMIAMIIDADDVVTKFGGLTYYADRRETLDDALRIYRAVTYGEYTERGAALAEHRAKEAKHDG